MAYQTNLTLDTAHTNEPLDAVAGAAATTDIDVFHTAEPFDVVFAAGGAATVVVTVPLLTITVSGHVPTLEVIGPQTVTVPLLTITISGIVPNVARIGGDSVGGGGMAIGLGIGLPFVIAASSAAAAPFAPSDRDDLLLWLRADDPALAGLADADPVTTIPDGSPSGADATNEGAPIYKLAIQNGQPVIRLPLTSDYFTIPAIDASASKRMTVYMVAALPATGDRSLWEFGTYGSAGAGKFGLTRANGGGVFAGIRGNGGQTEFASWTPMTGGASDFKLLAARCATDVSRQEVHFHVDGDQHGILIATSANTNQFGNLTSISAS
jgi:hypothetical protein